MNLGDNLKRIRKEHNLSQEELAEKLGVSRQSVSKWESKQAYPEMDKVLQLCKMFDLNIDELLNQDIKEVKNKKEQKSNKMIFINDFLNYITKSIDMFCSMKFKDKIKCLFEQCIVIGFIVLLFLILNVILSYAVSDIISFLPGNLYYLTNTLNGIYIIISCVLGAALFFYIFKTRYLDYYVIVKDDNKDNVKVEEKDVDTKVDNKVIVEKPKQKIIIRDPEHTGYKFITALLNIFIFFGKVIASFIGLCFCFSLVCLAISFVLSFVFFETGLLFVGGLLCIVACVIINIIILLLLYNFIVNNKLKLKKTFLIFILSLILFGVGFGIASIGFSKFNTVSQDDYVTKEEIIPMRDDILFYKNCNIKYVESSDNDIKIVLSYPKYINVVVHSTDLSESYLYYIYSEYAFGSNYFDSLKTIVTMINARNFVNVDDYSVTIYANKANLDKIYANQNKFIGE